MYISTSSPCQVASSEPITIGNIGLGVEFAMVTGDRLVSAIKL